MEMEQNRRTQLLGKLSQLLETMRKRVQVLLLGVIMGYFFIGQMRILLEWVVAANWAIGA